MVTYLYYKVIDFVKIDGSLQAAKLFLLSGTKALSSTALKKASIYLDVDIKLLESNC